MLIFNWPICFYSPGCKKRRCEMVWFAVQICGNVWRWLILVVWEIIGQNGAVNFCVVMEKRHGISNALLLRSGSSVNILWPRDHIGYIYIYRYMRPLRPGVSLNWLHHQSMDIHGSFSEMGLTGGSPIFRNTPAGCRPHYILPLILLTLCILLQHSSPDADGENAPGAPVKPSRDPALSKVIKAAETGLPAHQYNDISIFQNNLGACATQLSLGENRRVELVEHGITPQVQGDPLGDYLLVFQI